MTEEVEGEEVHEGVANVLTSLGGHHFVQTTSGQVVQVEPEMDYDENVVFRPFQPSYQLINFQGPSSILFPFKLPQCSPVIHVQISEETLE